MSTGLDNIAENAPNDQEFTTRIREVEQALHDNDQPPALRVSHPWWFKAFFDEGLVPEAAVHRATGAQMD